MNGQDKKVKLNSKERKKYIRDVLMSAYHTDRTEIPFYGHVKEVTSTHIVFDNLSMETGVWDYDGGEVYQLPDFRIAKTDFLTIQQAKEMELLPADDAEELGWVEPTSIEADNSIEFYADIDRYARKNKKVNYRISNIRAIRITRKRSPHFRDNLKRWAEYSEQVRIRAHVDEVNEELNTACLNNVQILDCDYFDEFIDGEETHVWVPFEEIQRVGIWHHDIVEFYANTYEYENSKGEWNYGLKNLKNIKVTDQRNLIVHAAESLFCNEMCMFRDHCYGFCCANEEWMTGMVQQIAISMCLEVGCFPGTVAPRLESYEWNSILPSNDNSKSKAEDWKPGRYAARGVVCKLQKDMARIKIFRFIDYKGLGRNVDDKIIEVELPNEQQQYKLFDIVELTGTIFCSKRNLKLPENERKYKLVDCSDIRVLTKDEVIQIASREATCDSCLLRKWCDGWEKCAFAKLPHNEWFAVENKQTLKETRDMLIEHRDAVINNMAENLKQMAYTPEESWNNVIDFMYHRYRHVEGVEPFFKQYKQDVE